MEQAYKVEPEPDSGRWHLFVVLALCAMHGSLALQAYEPYSFLHGDGAFYATINRSLLDGTLDQRPYQPVSWYERALGWNHTMDPGWSNVSLGRDGTWYPKHPILLPILTTPLFWLLGYPGLLLFNVACVVVALWIAFALARRVAQPAAAAVTVLAFAAMPLFTRGAYAYSNDVLYGVLAIWAVERFVAGRFAWSGLLFGLAIWAKATCGLLAAPFGLWLLLTRQWRPALQMATAAALPVTVHLGLNAVMFGHPLTTSYHRILVMQDGKQALFDIQARFGRPWRTGLLSLWHDSDQGLWPTAPLTVAGALGLPWLARALPAVALALVLSIVGYALFYARFEYTYARFFTPWAALLAVPAALALDRLANAAIRVVPPLFRRLGRLRTVVLGLVLVLAIGIGAVLARRPEHAWSAAQSLTQARVIRGDGEQGIPCDYFNPRLQKWECAQLEPENWHRWGHAVGDQCRFPGYGAKGWLWLHPNPTHAKRITWTQVPAGTLTLRFGLAPPSHFGGVQFRLLSGGKVLRELRVDAIGTPKTVALPVTAGNLAIEVPVQAFDWRQLCVAASID